MYFMYNLYRGDRCRKTKAVCELEHIDKVQAIYIAKSKVGITKIVKFVLTDEID